MALTSTALLIALAGTGLAQVTSFPALLTNSATCGYTNGVAGLPVTCASPGACTYFTTPYSAPNFGCCAGKAGCYVSTCIDYQAPGNTYSGGVPAIFGEQFLCGSNQPYCSTVILYGSTVSPGLTYSFLSYGCRNGQATTYTAYQTTFGSSSSHPASSSATPTADSSPSSLLPTFTSTATSDSSSGLSSGAEAGIGVGVAVGAIAALGAAAFWFLRRRRARQAGGGGLGGTDPRAHGYDSQEASFLPAYDDHSDGRSRGSPDGRGVGVAGLPPKADTDRDRMVELSSIQPIHELGEDRGVGTVHELGG